MNKYEIALILSADIEDSERAAIIEKITGLVQRFDGVPGRIDEWGKKRLAYEIQKQKAAFYYFVHFESENPDTPNELEKQLRIMDNVLRYLVVKNDGTEILPEKEEPFEEEEISADKAADESAQTADDVQEEAEESVEEVAESAEEVAEESADEAEEQPAEDNEAAAEEVQEEAPEDEASDEA